MNSRIDNPKSLIGYKIESVTSTITNVDSHTGQETFRYLVQLSSGVIVDLLPSDLLHCDNLPVDRTTAKLQVIDGPPTIIGEVIDAVITRKLESEEQAPLQQVALVLSSGRAAMNVFRCGGGNILHIESGKGIVRHFGEGWWDRWTNIAVDLEELAYDPQ